MKKYIVIGNPISHSLSPKLHNYWLKQNNIDAIYDKIKLEEDGIKEIIQDIKEQKLLREPHRQLLKLKFFYLSC